MGVDIQTLDRYSLALYPHYNSKNLLNIHENKHNLQKLKIIKLTSYICAYAQTGLRFSGPHTTLLEISCRGSHVLHGLALGQNMGKHTRKRLPYLSHLREAKHQPSLRIHAVSESHL